MIFFIKIVGEQHSSLEESKERVSQLETKVRVMEELLNNKNQD